MTSTVTVSLPDDAYLARLHTLGAWWCLGSSALDPRFLIQYAQLRLPVLREAGL